MKKNNFIKDARKEFEKWLKIPKILKANKVYISELKIANDRVDFLEVNNKKLNDQVMELKNKLKDNNIK